MMRLLLKISILSLWVSDSLHQIAEEINLKFFSEALQPIVFNYHASLLCTMDISIVLSALDRWEPIWDRAIDRVPSHQQQWLGIVRYSGEIAWLTRKIIETSMKRGSEHSNYLHQIAIYSTVSIHQFIQRCRDINRT